MVHDDKERMFLGEAAATIVQMTILYWKDDLSRTAKLPKLLCTIDFGYFNDAKTDNLGSVYSV